MRRIRLTERRDILLRARESATEKVADKIAPVFRKQFKRLERFLRKSNLRKRLAKLDTGDKVSPALVEDLFKQEDSLTSNTEEWEKWKEELTLALLLGLFLAVEELGAAENRIMTSRGRDALTYDAAALILAYQLRTGETLDGAALVTFAAVERIISDWYVTDDSFSDLMASLKRYFNETRVHTLSNTAVGNLHAQMIIQQMTSYGLTNWYWDHKGEDIPCSNPITVKGYTYAGCRELNGKVFQIGDPMPPDAAHPNCHCLPTPEGL
jgi:hypothetical protein